MKLFPILYVESRVNSLSKIKNDFTRFDALEDFIVTLCAVISRQLAMKIMVLGPEAVIYTDFSIRCMIFIILHAPIGKGSNRESSTPIIEPRTSGRDVTTASASGLYSV